MSHNPRSQNNHSGNDRAQERGNSEFREYNTSNQRMRPRGEEDVVRGRDKEIEWTSRLLAIDYDRNAE